MFDLQVMKTVIVQPYSAVVGLIIIIMQIICFLEK